MELSLKLERGFWCVFWVLIGILLLGRSISMPGGEEDLVRANTRLVEFDYVNWTLDAIAGKIGQAGLNTPRYLSAARQQSLVESYLKLTADLDATQAKIERIYADPAVPDKPTAAGMLLASEKELKAEIEKLAPIVEGILQQQVSQVVAELGLSTGGQLFPPLLYHVTPLPDALIVSPRDAIQQDYNISLEAGLSLDQVVQIEQGVESAAAVSALVVPVGGIGVYPTMVMSSTDLNWVVEVIAHEWIHNYLTLRPLGLNYDTSPELRTMNETTASLAGKEIGELVIRRFYPERAPAPVEPARPSQKPQTAPEPPAFDFRKEMHTTRLRVDELLAAGKIDEAEDYMEERRQMFWEQGYQIRRLNQAYFAFYGAYADEPGGAAGEDPVGPAVRALRESSGSLSAFIGSISQMTSFEQLQAVVQ